MAEQPETSWSLMEFIGARRAWLRQRVSELDALLEQSHPALHQVLPHDLGDRRMTGAVVLVRAVADDTQVESVSTTVGWLRTLIPHGHRHDLDSMVRELRSALVEADDPALRAWNVRTWEELVLSLWLYERASATDRARADDELLSRWGLSVESMAALHHPWRAMRAYHDDVDTLYGYLAKDDAPTRLLGHAVMADEDAVQASADTVAAADHVWRDADHLAFLAQQISATAVLRDWCSDESAGASDTTAAFLSGLSVTAQDYLDQVVESLVDTLSAGELALLDVVRDEHEREIDAYLTEFLDCAEILREWAAAGDFDSHVAEAVPGRYLNDGDVTWHGMRGSVPVWYHVVTCPAERAAALAFSGRPAGVITIRTDFDRVGESALFEDDPDSWLAPAHAVPDDWYPEPGIEVYYSSGMAQDLCTLLALTRTGYARLDFLTEESEGAFRILRSVKVEIPPAQLRGLASAALGELRRLASSASELPHVIAAETARREDDHSWAADFDEDEDFGDGWEYEEYEEEGRDVDPPGADDKADQDAAQDDGAPDSRAAEARSRTEHGELPEKLLRRVKRLLRKAEDRAATPEESLAYLQMAAKLVAKYGIEQAMLDDDEPTSEQPTNRVINIYAPWLRECRLLLGCIAQELRCRTVIHHSLANQHRVHAFGFAADLRAVEVLYAGLRLQMLAGADLANEEPRPTNEGSRAFKRSWMFGFIARVTERIREGQQSAREEADRERANVESPTLSRSVALVLADRSAAVDAELATHYPKLGKGRKMTYRGSGYWQGYADGDRADIGGPRLDDERDAELSV